MKILIIELSILVVFIEDIVCLERSYARDIAEVLNGIDLPQNQELCLKQLELMGQDLQNISIDSWALRMVDSWSKIPSGLLSVNLGEVGMFEECVNIDAEAADTRVRGKYCLGTIGSGNGNDDATSNTAADVLFQQTFRRKLDQLKRVRAGSSDDGIPIAFPVALCLPNSCSQESFQAVGNALLARLFGSAISVTYSSCQDIYDVNPELTPGAIATICFFAIIVAIMVASSVYDFYCKKMTTKPASQLLVAFSVYTNVPKLFKISTNSAELQCLNGIRVMSMCWVIVGHLTSAFTELPINNMADIVKWLDEWHSMFLVSGTLSVDTFFVIGGLLVVYIFMKSVQNKIKFNIFIFYLHRYIRLTPVLAAATLFNATLINYFGSGPNWPEVKTARQEFCVESWWRTILYIQNYVKTEKFCVSESWYLDIDMHLYVLSPIFLYALTKSKKIGSALLGLMIIVFMIVPFCITWIYELPGLITNFYADMATYQPKYYVATHTRAAPWFIGALAGFIISEVKFRGRKIKIHKLLNVSIWLIAIILMFTCVLVGHDTLRSPEYDKWGNALYNTFIRPTWGLCIAWIVFACVTNNAGFLNTILSLPLFQIMNRFIYSMYLTHLTIITIISYSPKIGVYFSVFYILYTFWGVFMFTFILSIFWVLAFESPVIIIEKVLLGKLR